MLPNLKGLRIANSNSDKAYTEVSINESNINKEQTYLSKLVCYLWVFVNKEGFFPTSYTDQYEASSSRAKGKEHDNMLFQSQMELTNTTYNTTLCMENKS